MRVLFWLSMLLESSASSWTRSLCGGQDNPPSYEARHAGPADFVRGVNCAGDALSYRETRPQTVRPRGASKTNAFD
jgi:hypothetical protein